jgi:GH15 family glucan-1,4-alpha-glucosidase
VHRDRCVVEVEKAVCLCDFGYEEVGDDCVQQTVCDPATTCAGHGSCTGTGLECDCDDGYVAENCDECDEGWELQGTDCVPVEPPDPCDPNPCGADPDRGRCVAESAKAVCRCDQGFDEVAGVCVPGCDVDATACETAHSSFGWIVSANGHGALVVNLDPTVLPSGDDRDNHRYMLFVHPYQTWGLNGSSQPVNTRDMLYDTFTGLRVDGVGKWLDSVPRDFAGYHGQDGIPHWVQTVDGLRVETFMYAPWQLDRPALVMLTRVTNPGTTAKQVSIYNIQNWHVGNTLNDSHKFPNTLGESIARDVDSGGLMEQAAGGAVFHYPLGTVSHYAAAAGASSADPWVRLNAGQDLGDEGSVDAGDNRVGGFQGPEHDLQPGETAWFGVVSAFDPYKDLTALKQDVIGAFDGLDAEQALAGAKAEWAAWRKPPPADLSAAERTVYRTAEAVLRMGQVWETTDKSKGQILASLPPGMWATAWPRDMAYSIAALVRSGHFVEARAALEFMLLADANGYKSFEHNGPQVGVGADYRISVCRYFGRGMEESDWNGDGPNVEFDGFGLFLWALGEYVRASGDTTIVDTHWATIRDQIANVLVGLQAANGMIRPDSSIWEVHWNGRQKQYTYTSLAAAIGLCQASQLADAKGAATEAAGWATAAQDIMAAIPGKAMDGDFLAQSVEELAGDSGYVDAAVIEAFNWNVMDPTGDAAATTTAGLLADLTVPNGIGLARNDDGGWYDSSEWILIDLRVSGALRAQGGTAAIAKADLLLDWVTAQARANMGLIAELHTRDGANYDGAVPMVGFGAGAYLLETWQRAEPATSAAPCGIVW